MGSVRFVKPTERQISDAIGNISRTAGGMKSALLCTGLFPAIPEPRPSDWLAENFEPGQRYSDFLQERMRVPGKEKNRIYIQPIGFFDPVDNLPLELLKTCAQTYFTLGVTLLQPLPIGAGKVRIRYNPFSGIPQMRSTDLMDMLVSIMPDDAFCMIGITMDDLYPDESWNFVFGEASSADGVGIFSFARYDPRFYGEPWTGSSPSLLLKRACKVLVHETSHMFSLSHCIYFHCIMNGTNHIEESDKRPLYFCPVCLRKLQSSTGFEIVNWYQRLLEFFRSCMFVEESDWVRKMLDCIASGDGSGQARG
jgi:archaemetzincin